MYTPAASLFLMRASDVKDKTLYVSKAVGADRLILALLTLVVYADQVKGLKAGLPRSEVPIKPTEGTACELLSSSPSCSRRPETAAQTSTEQQGMQQQQQQQQQVPGHQRALLAGDGSDTTRRSSVGAAVGSIGSSGSESTVGVSSLSSHGYVPLTDQIRVTLYGFDTVRVSGVCVGSGHYGSILQVQHSVLASCFSHCG
jgi:hypothetical protein